MQLFFSLGIRITIVLFTILRAWQNAPYFNEGMNAKSFIFE
ncbi:hypothetical protein [Oceanobacillus caeni]|nr:hypothetical protein [Oceanobacillus caeni]